MIRLLILSAIFQTILCFEVKYENYKVYKVFLEDEEMKNKFLDVKNQIKNLDIWGENRQLQSIDVMISPNDDLKFVQLLKENGISMEVAVENVESLIQKTSNEINTRATEGYNWTSYHNYDVIYDWFDSLVSEYPDKVSTFVAGYSHYGAEIKGIKVQLKSDATRVAIIEGGIHAREWISVAVSTYIANALLTSNDTQFLAAAEEMIWYILPVTNPDGYNHTFFVDRMHRKNMEVNDTVDCSSYSGGSGIGTDLNRNFEYMWMTNGGASDQPCSVQYAGPYPFSAPESQAIKSLVEDVADNLQMYLAIHSYSQLILFPYGHTSDPMDNYYEQYAVGRMAADAIFENSGMEYIVGNSAEAIYISTGGSDDWAKSATQARLVYCVELRDLGEFGFLLPADQIIETGEETIAGIRVMIEQLIRFDSWTSTSGVDNLNCSVLLFVMIISSYFVKFFV